MVGPWMLVVKTSGSGDSCSATRQVKQELEPATPQSLAALVARQQQFRYASGLRLRDSCMADAYLGAVPEDLLLDLVFELGIVLPDCVVRSGWYHFCSQTAGGRHPTASLISQRNKPSCLS